MRTAMSRAGLMIAACFFVLLAVGAGRRPASQQQDKGEPVPESTASEQDSGSLAGQDVVSAVAAQESSHAPDTDTALPDSSGQQEPDRTAVRVSVTALVVLALSTALLGVGLALLIASIRILRRGEQASKPDVEVDKRSSDFEGLRQSLKKLHDDVAEVKQRLDEQTKARDQADAATREALSKMPQLVAGQIRQLQSEQESARFKEAKQAFTQRARDALKDIEARHPILATAQATSALVRKLRSSSAGDSDMGQRYRIYLGATEMADNLAQLTRKAERTNPTTLDEDRNQFGIALDRLDRALTELAVYHRPIAFCDLLDKTNTNELKSERGSLMRNLGVEEFAPRKHDPVGDSASLDIVRVVGYGEKVRVAEVEGPGYRIITTGEVLRKPRVVVEQTG